MTPFPGFIPEVGNRIMNEDVVVSTTRGVNNSAMEECLKCQRKGRLPEEVRT